MTEPSSGDLLRGRFQGGVSDALHRINRSFDVDCRLFEDDIDGSVAHATMLGNQGILEAEVVTRIVDGLEVIRREFREGRFEASASDEDIHMAVERRLTEMIGPDGARLHVGRSRNDQVATDLRRYLMRVSPAIVARVRALQGVWVRRAGEHAKDPLPFYTHLQRAQPVTLGHVLLAYVEMIDPDANALEDLNFASPLGAGAGAGTTFPLDREATARALGFSGPARNSLEAVSSRRDAAYTVSLYANLATVLSRWGADLVLWTSREFGFARLGDSVSTGSSIMPQKRNPDGAELLRAKAVVVHAAHARLLAIERGLPLGYFKDLQEDKPAVFEAEDALFDMLDVAYAMAEDVTFDLARMRAAAEDPSSFLLATELADWLVVRGVPFRNAHEAVGQLVRHAEAEGVGLGALDVATLRAAHPLFDESVARVLTVDAALARRTIVGGPAPRCVLHEVEMWQTRLSAQ